MTLLASALLAGAAVAALVGVPVGAGLRLQAVLPEARRPVGLPRSRLLLVLVLPVVLATAALVGVVPGLLLGGAGGAAVRLMRSRRAAALRRDERARAVEACGVLAGELRAGRGPAEALAAAAELATGPSGRALAAAAASARLGGDVAGALRPTSSGAGAPAAGTPADSAVARLLDALAVCWTVCAASGSGLAAAVERLEGGLRAEQDQRRAVEAELAGPRATALLLAGLPCAGLLLASGLGADPLHVLLETPVGLVCLTGGLLLDGVGLWWTGRLVARAGGSA